MVSDAHPASLTKAHLAAAETTLRKLQDGRFPRLAMVTGSLAAGLGHAWSDIDLYVLDDGGRVEPRGSRVDGFMVQVTPITKEALDRVLPALTRFTATAADRSTLVVDDEFLTLAVRIAIGQVLVDHDALLPPPAASRTAIRRLLLARHAIHVGSLAEDVLGGVESGDRWLAVRASVLALEIAVDAFLTATGDLYVGPKFLYRRVARSLQDHGILKTYLGQLSFGEDELERDATFERACHRTRIATRLLAESLLRGYDEPAVDWPAPSTGGAGALTSPWFCPARYVDGWGLAGPDSGFRVSEEVVRIWLSADGKTTLDALDALRAHDPRFVDLDLTRYGEVIERLTTIGAIEVADATRDLEGGDLHGPRDHG